jgi:predicted outer membrane repeat protein
LNFSASGYRVNLDSCTFTGNSTGGTGGAVLANGRVRVRNSRFFDNTAGQGGGALTTASLSNSPYVRDTSIYGNDGGTGAGGLVVTGGVNTGSIRNTLFYGNGSDMSGTGAVAIAYTCSEDFLSIDATNVLAFSDPITLGPDDELFLDQGSDCIDVGDDVAANTDYAAIFLDWTQLTTASDGTLDASPVDAGTHYAP